MHHRGLLAITGDADRRAELVFTDRYGRTHAGVPPPEPPEPTDRVLVTGSWARPAGERVNGHWIYFNEQARAG